MASGLKLGSASQQGKFGGALVSCDNGRNSRVFLGCIESEDLLGTNVSLSNGFRGTLADPEITLSFSFDDVRL